MNQTRGYSLLPGGRSDGILLPRRYYFQLVRPLSLNVASAPRSCRRQLCIFAAKFTVNNVGGSSQQQTYQTVPSKAAPFLPVLPSGMMSTVAGGLVALTGLVALARASLHKSSSSGTRSDPSSGISNFTATLPVALEGGAEGGRGVAVSASPRLSADAAYPGGLPAGSDYISPQQQQRLQPQPVAASKPGQQHMQGLAEPGWDGDEGTYDPAGAFLRQQQLLERERERSRQAASELQIELLNRERELLEAQRVSLAQVAGAQTELKESRRKAELLEAMVGALRERLKREEERNATLAEEIEAGRVELAKSEEQRRDLQQRIVGLRNELADTQTRLSAALTRASELEARVLLLLQQNAVLEQRVGELEANLEARAVAVEGSAAAAEERLRMMQAAADEDQLTIAKLKGQLAEREAQLSALREGEAELQEVLEQSKAAASQMSMLLQQRDAELQLLRDAVGQAEERRQEAARELSVQVATLQQQFEPEVQSLRAAVLEAEERRLQEAGELRKQLEALQQQRDAEVQRLQDMGSYSGQAAAAELKALQAQLAALQSERDKEINLLNSQLQESAKHAEALQETAKAQAVAQQAEVEALQRQLEDAKLRAEQSSARRVAEVSELRSRLEQQVGTARQEALEARAHLEAVKEQLDGVLSPEWLELLENELRQAVLPSTNPPARSSTLPPEASEALSQLDSRETALRKQLEGLQAELAQLQAAAVVRLGPAMVARAQELEGAAAHCRKALRAREAVADQQGVQRVTQQLAALNSELAALYRTVMLPEARQRERVVRLELQDREMELRGVVEQQIRLQDRLEQEKQERQEQRQKAMAAASGPSQQQLRKAVHARVRELLRERDRQQQQQAVAREQQLQGQMQAAIMGGTEAQKREIKAMQEAVQKQARMMEESWKAQLEASTRALQEAAADKQRLAAEVNRSNAQVRQQLSELEALRQELLAARSTVAALRRAAEGSRASATQQSAGAAQEVARLRAHVQRLQDALQERERQYAASGQGTPLSVQQLSRGLRSPRQAPALLQLPAAASPLEKAAATRAPPEAETVVVRRGSSNAATTSITMASAKAGTPLGPVTTPSDGGVGLSVAGPGSTPSPAVTWGAAAADYAVPPAGTGSDTTSGLSPITPIRPGWPAQYGGQDPQLPGQPPLMVAASGAAAPRAQPSDAPSVGTNAVYGNGKGLVRAVSAAQSKGSGSTPATSSGAGASTQASVQSRDGSGGRGTSTLAGAASSSTNATGSADSSTRTLGKGSKVLADDERAGSPTLSKAAQSADMHSTASSSTGPSSSGSTPPGQQINGRDALPGVTQHPSTSYGWGSGGNGNGTGSSSGVSQNAAEPSAWSPQAPLPQAIGAAPRESARLPSDREEDDDDDDDDQQQQQKQEQQGASSASASFLPDTLPTSSPPVSSSSPPSSPAQELQRAVPGGPFDAASFLSSPQPRPSSQPADGGDAVAAGWKLPKDATSITSSSTVSATEPTSIPSTVGASGASMQVLPGTSVGAAPHQWEQQEQQQQPQVQGVTSSPSGPPGAPQSTPPASSQASVMTTSVSASAPSSFPKRPLAAPPLPSPWTSPPPSPAAPSSAAGARPTQQSPAAAAMAAAAGAAAAAKLAAAQGPPSPPPKPRGFNTPPISEWGRPGPQSDAEDEIGPASSQAASTPSTPSSPASSPSSSMGVATGATAPNNTFFSEAELGAEIAAIAQSLVQRTIGGRPGTAGAAAATNVAGSTAAGSDAQTSWSPTTAGATPPSAAMLSSPMAAAAGGPALAPKAVAFPGQPGLRPGAPTSPSNPASAGSSLNPVVGTARQLQLSVAGYGLPHVNKAQRGSEDAYFMATPAGGTITSGVPRTGPRPAGGFSALGVADGVGGWAEENIDPGQYSREIMVAVAEAAAAVTGAVDPRQLLAEAQASVRTIGSCTACVAILGPASTSRSDCNGNGSSLSNVLTIANLGDSGLRVVRRGSLVLATSPQEHQFNMPYQMAHPDNLPETDTAADAQIYQLALEPGDVIILATDGLYDNMWDEQLVSLAAAAAAGILVTTTGAAAAAAAQSAAKQLASSLVNVAFKHAQDTSFRSPWAVEIANQPSASWLTRLFPRGGKMDDITAVVGIVTAV